MKKNKKIIAQSVACDQPINSHKLVYEKPVLKTVSLFADEVLDSCKLADGTCQGKAIFSTSCKTS